MKKCTRMNVTGLVGQRCSEENLKGLCQEGHGGYGRKVGNGAGP